jgi:hypothetical protein
MSKLNAANLNKFVPVLAKYGFSLKTKAFKSYLTAPQGRLNDFKTQFKQFGLKDNTAEVYALMVLNYNLNGSTSKAFFRANNLINTYYSFDKRKNMFTDYVESVQNKTFKRWADCLAEIKLVEAELIESVKLPEQVKPAAIKLNVNPVVNPEFTAILTLKQIEALLGYKVQLIA